jgi:predicted Fe-S protein YdhL (DUF1289 family)
MSDILQEAETLIEKHTTSGYIHRDATLLLPGLVSEIKRLQDENDYLRNGTCLGCVAKLEELAKWQQIAIKQRALINFIETEERYAYSEHVILSDDEMSIAAKELGLQVDDTGEELTIAYMLGSKKANDRLKVLQEYVRRLEKEFLDLKMNCCFVAHAGGISEEEIIEYKRKTAQAALDKIRMG